MGELRILTIAGAQEKKSLEQMFHIRCVLLECPRSLQTLYRDIPRYSPHLSWLSNPSKSSSKVFILNRFDGWLSGYMSPNDLRFQIWTAHLLLCNRIGKPGA
jgi:hypothetical protein